MKLKEEILTVLKMYGRGEYDTKTFCDNFIELCFYEKSGYQCFSGEDKVVLDELAAVIERFSSVEEDLETYSETYTTSKEVEDQFDKVKIILNL